MNPWIDAAFRLGVPTAILGLMLWKIWPFIISLITDVKSQRMLAEKRWLDAAIQLREQQREFHAQLKSQHDDFIKALDGYNEANMQTAKELGNVAQAVKELAQSPRPKGIGTPKR